MVCCLALLIIEIPCLKRRRKKKKGDKIAEANVVKKRSADVKEKVCVRAIGTVTVRLLRL